ncbi:MAG: TrmH family RNA methyltransferase [Opitutales bacterium]
MTQVSRSESAAPAPNDAAAIAFLETQITEAREARFQAALAERTRHLTVVLEDIYQYHNADAVVRSCEAFGVQDLHLIELCNRFRVSDNVTRGAHQWVSLHRYRHPDLEAHQRAASRRDLGDFPGAPLQAFSAEKLRAIREQGYRIAATVPGEASVPIDALPLDAPIALLIGNEMQGLTPAAIETADLRTHLPLRGLTQSLNLSVFTAICLQVLTTRLRKELPSERWKLPPAEARALYLNWLKTSVDKAAAKLASLSPPADRANATP